MPTAIENHRRIVIEAVAPELDCGRYAVKREVGDTLEVTADIFKEGHDLIRAAIRYRVESQSEWREVPMTFIDNDRWSGTFGVDTNAPYQYTIVAWTDVLASWSAEVRAKNEAGQDISSELQEGVEIVRAAAKRAKGDDRKQLMALMTRMESGRTDSEQLLEALDPSVAARIARSAERGDLTQYDRILPLQVDRVRARFAAWYELFPRSMADDASRHGTFDDVIAKLPYVRGMGFDVLYFPPIHPIGLAFRKGKNNTLDAGPDQPGSPYAIGGKEGGHKSVHPELGTLQDFRRLVAAAAEHGLEIALDFAIQVSPDHPYAKNTDWFYVRPDGTIKYAENPPKKYQDIYPLNMYGADWEAQWEEWRSVIEFWIEQGVKTFRVDNPHTKPVQFWYWLIREIQRDHPEIIFLSEAFTRPKVMRALAKAGFSQSYTYFTWRNTKQELEEYLTELTQGPMKEYFRGNLFPNTPDILHDFLQRGGQPAFRIRAVLAATLSSVYGIYSGFELCENTPIPGREEYLNSEKYEIKEWDWDRPGNIRPLITRLNQIRRENPALHEYDNLRFHLCDNDRVLFYAKAAADGQNLLFFAVSLDPYAAHEVTLFFPLPDIRVAAGESWKAEELLEGGITTWQGSHQRIKLDPASPARIWRVATG